MSHFECFAPTLFDLLKATFQGNNLFVEAHHLPASEYEKMQY